MSLMGLMTAIMTIILIFLIAIDAVAFIHVLFHMRELLEAWREAKAEKEAKKILSESRDTTIGGRK